MTSANLRGFLGLSLVAALTTGIVTQSSEDARQAAAAHYAAGRFAEAAQAYRELAVQQPRQEHAAESHRLAILCTVELLRKTAPADREPIAKSYETLLEEHLRLWPTQATADEARVWFARLQAGRRDWPAAIETLDAVQPTSAQFGDRVLLLIDCYGAQLGSLTGDAREQSQKQDELLSAATHRLQPVITGTQNRWPNAWSDVQRKTALALARLHNRYGEPTSPYAAQLLTAALRGEPAVKDAKANGEFQTTARLLLVVALVRNGKTADAQAAAQQLTTGPADMLLETLAAVLERAPPGDPDSDERQTLGKLALTLIRCVDAGNAALDKKSLARLSDYRAAGLAATGERNAALAQYAAAAAQSPNDGDIQEHYAALLSASAVPEELRQSIARWQDVESHSRKGGARWRRARRARIELLTRLGDKKQAEALLRLTRVLYPDWDKNGSDNSSAN